MKGKIDHIGMWTWGGRVYNWKKYFENMQKSGMDTVVLWHTDTPPRAAREIQDYGHGLGIEVIWGFNWGWNSPVCLDSEEDAAHWRKVVTDLIRDYYAQIEPDGICFQVGGTEFDASCRLGCPVCEEAYKKGVGELYVKFAGTIMDAVRKEWPDIKLYANLHLGGVHQSYEALKVLDPSINIMWEDLPGPAKNLHVPFAYDWNPAETDLKDSTLDMVKRMCELRGDKEDVAFIVKGFPCHWGGEDPLLLEDFALKALATTYQKKWDEAADYMERKLDQALKVFRVIAESNAARKSVLLLVENGLWEYKREYAAMLITEALKDPFRGPGEIIEKVRDAETA